MHNYNILPVQVVGQESDIQFLYHNEIALEVVQSLAQHIHVKQWQHFVIKFHRERVVLLVATDQSIWYLIHSHLFLML